MEIFDITIGGVPISYFIFAALGIFVLDRAYKAWKKRGF
jgi:hypothetical protein